MSEILVDDIKSASGLGRPFASLGFDLPNGTAIAPSLAFRNSLGTGLYLPNSNVIGFACNSLSAHLMSVGKITSFFGIQNSVFELSAGTASRVHTVTQNVLSSSSADFFPPDGMKIGFGIAANLNSNDYIVFSHYQNNFQIINSSSAWTASSTPPGSASGIQYSPTSAAHYTIYNNMGAGTNSYGIFTIGLVF